ncbi:S9 family peptidase [Aidingimonas halophila]|uniref:Dipeptidyl aminopeptidase/acylaminoacyl peptidase n=1 Tax=Aidingimonas halophila TaxID=574349 RepID=A0A1H2Z8N4_9GAMM|nr:prolyl oligopeptidase family serine peptidase [Aidingimonas halophila]GHC15490.1 peptidase S9 [Aidingimonas halophila]SDX13338.1 Dipeptidyl aminopeptidase/acylaminoacyl peptidase [Aidingimonas halophila]
MTLPAHPEFARIRPNSTQEADLAAASLPADGLSDLRVTTAGIFWLATDSDSGHRRLWRWHDEHCHAISHAGHDIGSRVNGYGGGAHALLGDRIITVDAATQALWSHPVEGGTPAFWWSRSQTRYGGLLADDRRQRLIVVEETDSHRDASQRLVALTHHRREILAEGADFYGAPALSPDGRTLAWVEWSLPDMPWQRSWLRIATLSSDGHIERRLSWDGGAAVTQPRFSDEGELIVISDHHGWWQPYRWLGDNLQPLGDVAADHVPTPWTLGDCHHVWHQHGGIVMHFEQGRTRLSQVDTRGRRLKTLLPDVTRIIGLGLHGPWLYALTQGMTHSARLERWHLTEQRHQILQASPATHSPTLPETLSICINDRETVNAFLYTPTKTTSACPPPLIVRIHGGPTAACYPVFDPLIHYWIQHGYAVADLNPRGSGNFGRDYRERLAGGWGQLDVEDANALAEALIESGRVDPRRLFIRGQSAGGFTVLNTLASGTRYCAGASLYGVTDALRLAGQTHRFESGYLDWLLGEDSVKFQRSPVNRLDAFQAPALFFQGTQDRVVVPDQTLRMASSLRQAGHQAEVVLFAGEGHGIRHPANRRRMIARELAFFDRHGNR